MLCAQQHVQSAAVSYIDPRLLASGPQRSAGPAGHNERPSPDAQPHATPASKTAAPCVHSTLVDGRQKIIQGPLTYISITPNDPESHWTAEEVGQCVHLRCRANGVFRARRRRSGSPINVPAVC